METVSAQVASKLSIRSTKGESPLLRTSRQKLAGGISCLESACEHSGRLGAFYHDQVIVLPLEAGCGKVRAVGVPDQRRLALISVRLPDREIGSSDFNDVLAMTNEGAEGEGRAGTDLCQKVSEVS